MLTNDKINQISYGIFDNKCLFYAITLAKHNKITRLRFPHLCKFYKMASQSECNFFLLKTDSLKR